MDDIKRYWALDEIAFGIGYDSRSKAEKKMVDKMTAQFLRREKKVRIFTKLKVRARKVSK